MAKRTYIGVGSIARRVRKAYIGVDGKARRIKKAYIGVDGVARCFFGAGEFGYYGKVTPLPVSRDRGAGATVKESYAEYAFLVGGYSSADGNYVAGNGKSVYDGRTLTSYATDTYPISCYEMAGISINGCAIFAGGGYTYEQAYDYVAAYTGFSTRVAPARLAQARRKPAAATIRDDYALFAGGYTSWNAPSWYVDIYDKSLTKISYDFLSSERYAMAGTSVGDFAIFAGGVTLDEDDTAHRVATAEAYDSSLTRREIPHLSYIPHGPAAARTEKHALFAGGSTTSYDYADTVDVYDESLTRSNPTAKLSQARSNIGAASLGGYAIFAGGGSYRDATDVYDSALVKIDTTNISPGRYDMLVATAGDFAFFAGGSHQRTEVDVYQLI